MEALRALVGLAVIAFFIWWWWWWAKQRKKDKAGIEPTSKPGYDGPKIMQARKFGRCIECGKAIRPGELIAWRETEGARHMRCEHPEADNPGPETEWS